MASTQSESSSLSKRFGRVRVRRCTGLAAPACRRLLRSELAFPGRLGKAESEMRDWAGRFGPAGLVAERRSAPCWLPWRSGTPPGDSNEPPELVGLLRVALPLARHGLSKVYCQAWTKRGLRCRNGSSNVKFYYSDLRLFRWNDKQNSIKL